LAGIRLLELEDLVQIKFSGWVGIPAKPNTESGTIPNGDPGRTRTPSERSDAGNSIVPEVFGFVKRNVSEAQRRKKVASRGFAKESVLSNAPLRLRLGNILRSVTSCKHSTLFPSRDGYEASI
jgi:hypothetical protein